MKTDLDLAKMHRYRLPSGEIGINVTAISGFLDDGKSSGFAGAAHKLAQEGKYFREEWKAKGERGTRIHKHLNSWLLGHDIECEPDERGYVDALEKFIVEHDPVLIETEAIVLSEWGYGGTLDLIARMRQGPWEGMTGIIDLKTGAPYSVEHTLQLCAYRESDGLAEYDEGGMLSGLRELPKIDFAACLYVHEDGSYDLIHYPADDKAFQAFHDLLGVYQWTRSDTMKELAKTVKAQPKTTTRPSPIGDSNG
jgi:hypothetical protein